MVLTDIVCGQINKCTVMNNVASVLTVDWCVSIPIASISLSSPQSTTSRAGDRWGEYQSTDLELVSFGLTIEEEKAYRN